MWQQIKDSLGTSVIQAIGASAVVGAWSYIMINGDKWVQDNPPTWASFIAVPLIFMITAVLAAGSVLGYPLYLVLTRQRWGQAITLVAITLFWLGLITTAILLTAIK